MALREKRNIEDLDPRAREVLREIILQYVSLGEPISSRSLAKGGRFGLSPASLRNVMADLEEAGFVYQPHTSAGRVPTDRGYRFFIDHLMRSRRISSHDRDVIDDSVSKANELDEVMHLASRLLSKLSDQVGVVFLPNFQNLAMRSINFIPVAERKIMVVVVGLNGVVVNKIVDTAADFSRDELDLIGRYISDEFSGRTLMAVRDQLSNLLQQERAAFDEGHRRAITLGREAVEFVLPSEHDLFLEGASSILNKPEFSDAGSLRKTMQAFDQRERLIEILTRCLNEEGLQILIGSESTFTQSYNFSLVATRYGSTSSPTGLVGVLGPTRMEYARVATIVEYLGQALSRKIEETQEQSG